MSVIGAKSSASAAAARSIAALVERLPDQRRLGLRRALRRRRHAAEGEPRLRHLAALERQAERAHHGGNVLVEALRELVAGEAHVRRESAGTNTDSTNSPGARSCLP